MQEVTNMMELALHKIIREREKRIEELEDITARHKLGHDKDVKNLERLEMELSDRDECIYRLHKQNFTLQEGLKSLKKMTEDLDIYTLKETIDIKQKEIDTLKGELFVEKGRAKNLEAMLRFQEIGIKKTA